MALARAGEGHSPDDVHVIDSVPLAGGAFSAQLVPQIAGLLEKHDFRKTQIDAFIVVSGPGSFTGLRVGLAAIKAFAEVLGKPIVAVSLLEILALAAGRQGFVLALLDAGRGEVYASQYEVTGESAHSLRDEVIRKEDLVTFARTFAVSTSDPSLAAIARDSGVPVVELDGIKSEMVSVLGWRKLRAGETVSPELLDANYFRRSDAELFVKPTRD